jgi:hypothetical protein
VSSFAATFEVNLQNSPLSKCAAFACFTGWNGLGILMSRVSEVLGVIEVSLEVTVLIKMPMGI